uniref:Uncharacterized protein n=1 Tax=Anopheles minimus TaxID=112268 RepID=A0A182W7U4_9DIPT
MTSKTCVSNLPRRKEKLCIILWKYSPLLIVWFNALPIRCYNMVCEPAIKNQCVIEHLNPRMLNLCSLRAKLPSGVVFVQFRHLETSALDPTIFNCFDSSVKRVQIVDSLSLLKLILPGNFTIQQLTVRKTHLAWIHFQTNHAITAVWIRFSHLDQIPPSLRNLKSVNYIQLRNSFIQLLNLDLLEWCRMLDSLDLSYNNIHTITSTLNDDQRRSLTFLNLSHNQLKIVNLKVLSPLGWFKNIDLSHNKIELLVGRFSSDHLEGLILSNNRLKTLDFCQWKPIPSLQSLSLDANELAHLRCTIDHFNPRKATITLLSVLPNDTTLIQFRNFAISTFDRATIKHLPPSIERLEIIHSRALQRFVLPSNFTISRVTIIKSQLNWIELHRNDGIQVLFIVASKLQQIPSSLRNLKNLAHFKLQQSFIHHLNLDLLQWCPVLESLQLMQNRIRTITSTLNGGQQRKAESLNLSNNQLTIINFEVLSPLGWFKYIDLSHNKIELLVGRFSSDHLEGLILSNNRLKTLDFCQWKPIPSLQSLSLDANELAQLLVGRFSSDHLQGLILSHNRLKALDFCQWKPIPSLQSLSLDANELARVPNCMHHLPSLSFICFSNNKLTSVNMDAFGEMDNLTDLNLTANRISLITFREDKYPKRLGSLILKGNKIECNNPGDIPFCPLDIEFQTSSPDSAWKRNNNTLQRQLTITTG